eukprot:Em0020g1062a
MGESKVIIPPDVDTQYWDLCKRHRSLLTQMAIEKEISLIPKGVELPSLAHMSAHLSTATPGSKSNLLLDDGATDSRQHSPLLALSDIKLPTILDASFTNEPSQPMATPFSLMPIVTSSLTSQNTLNTTTTIEMAQVTKVPAHSPVHHQSAAHSPVHHQSTAHSPVHHIAEVSPTETLVGRTLLSAKKTGLLSKVSSFTPPLHSHLTVPQ